jgi:hypothetical protein
VSGQRQTSKADEKVSGNLLPVQGCSLRPKVVKISKEQWWNNDYRKKNEKLADKQA